MPRMTDNIRGEVIDLGENRIRLKRKRNKKERKKKRKGNTARRGKRVTLNVQDGIMG